MITKPGPVAEELDEEVLKEPAFPGLVEKLGEVTSEEVSPVPEIDTSDWKTYRNEEYGFEVKYPIEASVVLKPKGGGLIFIGEVPTTGFGYGIRVDVIENPKALSAHDWYSEYYISCKKKAETESVPFFRPQHGEYIQLNGSSAYKVSVFGFDHMIIELYLSHGDYIYKISYRDESANDPDWQIHEETINKMLSTFIVIK